VSSLSPHRLKTAKIKFFLQFSVDGTLNYGEVQFFFQATIQNKTETLALLSTYSAPDAQLLRKSHNVVWACHYEGPRTLEVINIACIHSVVTMAPLPHDDSLVFVGEKLGLDMASLGGTVEDE
jgi:hypothetical protein